MQESAKKVVEKSEKIVDKTESVVRSFLDYELLTVSDRTIDVTAVLVFASIVLATFLLSHLLQRAIGRLLKRSKITEEGSLAALRRLLHYVVVSVGLTTALHNLGFELSALFAAGAVFAVAIGFAMQNIVQNFVSGVILLVERSIKPHDVLRVGDRVVKVSSMGIRSTVVRTLDEEDLIVPNADLVQSVVTNYTLRDSMFRLRVSVGVAYDSDLRLVHQVLRQAAEGAPWRNRHREPRILLTAFGSSSVDFEVSVWIEEPWRMAQRRSDLHHLIWWALKDAGVVIAFPQVDVHFDAPVQQIFAPPGGYPVASDEAHSATKKLSEADRDG